MYIIHSFEPEVFHKKSYIVLSHKQKTHPKKYRDLKSSEYGNKITRRAYTLLILYHHTQNGTTVLDSRFQHSTG